LTFLNDFKSNAIVRNLALDHAVHTRSLIMFERNFSQE